MKKNNITCVADDLFWVNKNSIRLSGYCFINGINLKRNSDVKKSVVISNEHNKYIIPLKNDLFVNPNLNHNNEDYKYAGFSGVLDLGFINKMDSLSPGEWSVEINIISGGYSEYVNIRLDENIEDIESRVVKNKQINGFVSIEPKIKDGVLVFSVSEKNNDKLQRQADNKNSVRRALKSFKKFLNDKKLEFVGYIYADLKKLPLNNDRVVFLSASRANMDGNFEFVYNELVKRGGFDIKCMLKASLNDNFKFFEKFLFLYYVATSKYILLDDYYPSIYNFKLRDEVELIQLWHACGAFKTFGFSRLGKEGGPQMRSKNHRNYTKAIVSSESIRQHYAEGFGISEDRVMATGIPRTDIFFNEDYKKEKIDYLLNKYPSLKNKKVIMFAPTFRGNGQKTAYYDFDMVDMDFIYENLKEEYMFIVKMHPFVKDMPKWSEKYPDFVLDLSSEREINDLLFISDILITDYSSVCFEFSLLNRPMIFFAYDMDDYIEKRDFYYPYKDFIPGNLACKTEDVVNIIKNQSFELDKLDSFRKNFFSHFDGKSAERVVDMMISLRDKNKN